MHPDQAKEFTYGIHPVLEALKSDQEIEKIFIQKGLKNDTSKEISQLARERNVPIGIVPVEKLNRITRKNHQGVVCYISAIQYASLDSVIESCYSKAKVPFVLILDQITDVRNFGAIARTAECAGVDAIIVPQKGAALITSDAMRTSAGALNYLPVCRVKSLPTTVQYLKDSGFEISGASEKSDKTLFDGDFMGPLGIVMGSEEVGISDELTQKCNHLYQIPMSGKVNSLNVSVASSIFIFEVIRQRMNN